MGSEHRRTFQIGVWETRPSASELLATVVENAVILGKGRLHVAGVTDATVSASGFEPSAEMAPRVGYVRVIRVTVQWERTMPRRHTGLPATVTFGPILFRS